MYAQVYPVVEKISFTPGQDSLRIPIQNDFDFTDLTTVKIDWSIREDERVLASGTNSITGQSHAESTFKLPVEALKTVRAGKTYYAWFIFTNVNGEEITRDAVELCPSVEQIGTVLPCGKISVNQAETVTIETGNIRYVFSPQTGQLVSAEARDKQLITDLRPIIWSPLDPCEKSAFGKENVRKAVDLNQYTTSVKEWSVEDRPDEVIIRAKVDCHVDSANHFTTIYRYSIGVDGRLDVNYEILTDVAIPQIPIVGMTIKTVPELKELHWLGLGPYDAYPNKKAAPILGVWGGEAGSADVTGMKATRWIERSNSKCGFRIMSNGYMKHDASHSEVMHILSYVFGRPEKGRQADESVPQMRTDTGVPFVGGFSILLNADLQKK